MGKPYCQECNQHTEVAELREQLADARRMVTIAFDPDEYEQGRAAVAEIATLRAEVERLRAALREMTEWFWGVQTEDAMTSFERVGEEFYADTGMMRPGKSYPLESYPPDDEVRRKTWDAWVKKKRDALEAKARAALAAKETP